MSKFISTLHTYYGMTNSFNYASEWMSFCYLKKLKQQAIKYANASDDCEHMKSLMKTIIFFNQIEMVSIFCLRWQHELSRIWIEFSLLCTEESTVCNDIYRRKYHNTKTTKTITRKQKQLYVAWFNLENVHCKNSHFEQIVIIILDFIAVVVVVRDVKCFFLHFSNGIAQTVVKLLLRIKLN